MCRKWLIFWRFCLHSSPHESKNDWFRQRLMEHEFEFGPAFTMMTVNLSSGEQLKVEPGAMVAQSSNVDMKSGMSGGFFKGLMKSMVGGESFILNTSISI